MVRYKTTISYDGRLFTGLQQQSSEHSVQEELEKTLQKLNSDDSVKVHGADRTDLGVHAYGQAIYFDLPQARDAEKLRSGLGTQSPEDVDAVKVEQASDGFHARYNKCSKTYESLVDTGRPKSLMIRHCATHYPHPLDLTSMQEVTKDLVGTRDFTGFTASRASAEDEVRTIARATAAINNKVSFFVFTFNGNSFLYKQVHSMVGTLLKIDSGYMPVSQIRTVLESKNHDLVGPTATGNGPYLKETNYDE